MYHRLDVHSVEPLTLVVPVREKWQTERYSSGIFGTWRGEGIVPGFLEFVFVMTSCSAYFVCVQALLDPYNAPTLKGKFGCLSEK